MGREFSSNLGSLPEGSEEQFLPGATYGFKKLVGFAGKFQREELNLSTSLLLFFNSTLHNQVMFGTVSRNLINKFFEWHICISRSLIFHHIDNIAGPFWGSTS